MFWVHMFRAFGVAAAIGLLVRAERQRMQLRRLDEATGMWRVQPPAATPATWLSDEAYARMLDDWRREMRDAA